jgi:hypothetical protein
LPHILSVPEGCTHEHTLGLSAYPVPLPAG